MLQDLLVAFGLVLVIEGILPFVSPGHLRKTMLMASQLDDSTLRILGSGAMAAGLVIIYLVK